ncbi:hypothetical protein [Corynebacterium hadale]|uniref:hypothetical protein n=1 Tax=Corynebacterium hadale TaxID=2026255 RepID=UPI001056AB74|nr:hypothetical protein [Corynebacterium hadale]
MTDLNYILDVARRFSDRAELSVGRSKQSSTIAKLLFDAAESNLAKRMLMQLALWDGSRVRSRFVTDVLCQQACEWAALPFAGHGITDSKKGWQLRRLRSVHDSVRPPATRAKAGLFYVHPIGDALFVKCEGQQGTGSRLALEDGVESLLRVVFNNDLKFCNETLLFDADSFNEISVESFVELLGSLSVLWPINIVGIGKEESIKSVWERDLSTPENIFWLLRENERLVPLGCAGQPISKLQAGWPNCELTLDEFLIVLQFAKAEVLLQLIPDKASRDRFTCEYIEELSIGRNDLANLSLPANFQTVQKQILELIEMGK